MDYKNTLNLPKTDFPMKGDLPKREPLILSQWEKQGIFGLIMEKSKGRQKYILHDGPPYANGNIHIGHALNKTLKDIIVKYKTMRGFDSPYVPGWDCHGLPVEHQLFKELKINKYQIGQVEFRKKAQDYALKYVAIQKDEFKRLGVFGDWDAPYLTLSHEYEEAIVRSFLELVKKGYIYRGLKPVNWCYRCETALAEAEVEYEDHTSPSIFVKFRLEETKEYPKDSFLVIWTTTPWTLVGNVAVAVHPDLTYCYLKTEKGLLIVARDLLENVVSLAGIEKYEVLKEVGGNELEGLTYAHPFALRKGRVVLADYVSREEGSGLVHTAPGHGSEDYFTGLKYNLDIIMPVDSKGNFDGSAGEFKGQNISDANSAILEKLKTLNALLWEGKIQHSYPHCWRCKTPIIFRTTKQWFLKIDHDNLRERLLRAIHHNVQWIPAAGEERIASMVELRPDWCLSRQRYWGVPIPALVCTGCKEEFLEPRVIKEFAELVAQEGSDCWFVRDLKEFLPSGVQCPHCGKTDFAKGTDILDVWFDSGVSHQAVLKKRKELEFPCALYLEGSDQHRGWFQSSLIPSMCIDDKAPFRSVLTHGHVVDGEGRKMSKSLGNVIPPQGIIKDFGADIVRLWVAASDYNEDIRISPLIISRLSEAYRKMRNTARFMLSNLYDFNPDTDKVAEGDLRRLDVWILAKGDSVLNEINAAYESFCFYKAYQAMYDFCNEDLSMRYLDMVKGRLYTFAADSLERRAAQTAIYELLSMLVVAMAPILVFTAEDIWQHMPKTAQQASSPSVHLAQWPIAIAGSGRYDETMKNIFSLIMALLPDAAQLLEKKRARGEIGSSFDAKINLLTKDAERYTFLASLKADVSEIFRVSQVEIEKVDTFAPDALTNGSNPDIALRVLNAEGQKCSRCWNYVQTVGANRVHPLLCDNCVKAIGGS